MQVTGATEHCSGCGWFVTGCSRHEVTDVAQPGRWATRLWVSRLTYSGNSLWEAAVKGKSPQKSKLLYKENLLRPHASTIPLCRSTGSFS